MISQGQLFPFEELKEEQHVETKPEIHNVMKTDGGYGYGSWEQSIKDKKNKVDKKTGKKSSSSTSKKGEQADWSSQSNNMGMYYDFIIEDPHTDVIMDAELEPVDFLETVGLKKIENFKEGGHGGHMERGHGGHMERGHGGHGSGGHMESGGGHEHGYWGHGGTVLAGGAIASVPFWVENPNVLFYPGNFYEIFPVETMSYNQKLNSVSRLVILLTLVGFVFVRNMRILWIGAVCLLAIFLLQYAQNKNELFGGNSVSTGAVEGFDSKLERLGVDAPAEAVIKAFATDDPAMIGKREFFDAPRANNPYNNVLITDIVDNPNKLPAPPAYYPETEKEILDKTKEAIQKMNPTFPDMTNKLFASLDDHFEFEQSARQFYSNPSTTVPNDQGAFAAFCYGEMISCKEGNMFACARDAPRHNLY